MKIALGMSIHDPYPGAPINVIAISLKTFFGSVKEFCSIPNPADAKASKDSLFFYICARWPSMFSEHLTMYGVMNLSLPEVKTPLIIARAFFHLSPFIFVNMYLISKPSLLSDAYPNSRRSVK